MGNAKKVYELEVEFNMPHKLEFIEWMRKHGIDEEIVVSPSTVIVDYGRRRIITEEYVAKKRNPPPKPNDFYLVRIKDGCPDWKDNDRILLWKRQIHQHEGILPLPPLEEWRVTEIA